MQGSAEATTLRSRLSVCRAKHCRLLLPSPGSSFARILSSMMTGTSFAVRCPACSVPRGLALRAPLNRSLASRQQGLARLQTRAEKDSYEVIRIHAQNSSNVSISAWMLYSAVNALHKASVAEPVNLLCVSPCALRVFWQRCSDMGAQANS